MKAKVRRISMRAREVLVLGEHVATVKAENERLRAQVDALQKANNIERDARLEVSAQNQELRFKVDRVVVGDLELWQQAREVLGAMHRCYERWPSLNHPGEKTDVWGEFTINNLATALQMIHNTATVLQTTAPEWLIALRLTERALAGEAVDEKCATLAQRR